MSSSIPKIITGDDVSLQITLTVNGLPHSVASSATVKASVISLSSGTVIIPSTTVLESFDGSDWANGLVVAQFSSLITDVTIYGPAQLELQVDDGGKLTWFDKVEIKQGTIDQ